jgi:hypothetical protein
MKNILIVTGILLFVGGATFALVSHNVFNVSFQQGDKPTEQQFTNTIDSEVNLQDNAPKPTGLKEHNPTKEYSAGDTVVKTAPVYQAKVVTEDQKEFKLDAVQSVTFRWTPLVPKPREPVTYRLKVWQLMEGQNGSQAMRTNEPVVTKDVTDVSETTVSGLYTGPCKPPYLCDFVWSAELISTASTNTGSSDATTPATTPATAEVSAPASTEGTSGATQGTSDGTH